MGAPKMRLNGGSLMAQTDLTIAGVGGQGSILAGIILGTAAVTYDKKYAVQTQAYSSELRGGFAATWVIVSDDPVVFPRVIHPDVLVAQAQDSISRFGETVKHDGVLIVDKDMVTTKPDTSKKSFSIPATSIARNQLKAPVTANMIMLGALCNVTGIVSREALEQAIAKAVPKGKDQLNLDAFNLGFEGVTAS
jgi:2-oxoglutarate ferredoxin oxidoreductase subunit gamma